jgi:Tol biopolymer transport system component
MTDSVVLSIWLVDVESGTQSALLSGSAANFSPRWSPDGSRLAFVSTAEGGRAQLFVRWMQTGSSARIADLTNAPQEMAWSHDGKSIAFTMWDPDDKVELGKAPPKPDGANWAPRWTSSRTSLIARTA